LTNKTAINSITKLSIVDLHCSTSLDEGGGGHGAVPEERLGRGNTAFPCGKYIIKVSGNN